MFRGPGAEAPQPNGKTVLTIPNYLFVKKLPVKCFPFASLVKIFEASDKKVLTGYFGQLLFAFSVSSSLFFLFTAFLGEGPYGVSGGISEII